MPFFQNSRHFNIHGGTMNDIGGDQNITNHAKNDNRTNSGNTTSHNAINSHNNSSTVDYSMNGNRMINSGIINNVDGWSAAYHYGPTPGMDQWNSRINIASVQGMNNTLNPSTQSAPTRDHLGTDQTTLEPNCSNSRIQGASVHNPSMMHSAELGMDTNYPPVQSTPIHTPYEMQTANLGHRTLSPLELGIRAFSPLAQNISFDHHHEDIRSLPQEYPTGPVYSANFSPHVGSPRCNNPFASMQARVVPTSHAQRAQEKDCRTGSSSDVPDDQEEGGGQYDNQPR